MDTTATAAITVPIADAVDETPRMLDTYALVYAFTLMWTVVALLALSQLRLYSYSPAYTALMMLPPGLGVTSLLLTERRGSSVRSLLGRATLLTVLAAAGSVVLIFGGMLTLPVVIDWVVNHLSGAAPFAIGLLAVMTTPLVVTLVREVRAGLWPRAAVLLVAIGIVAVALYTSATPSRFIVDSLRKDQMSFFMGALNWYLPAYALAGAILRKVGLG
jgi:hypothetical protein